MSFTGNENHGITLSDAAVLTANYRAAHPMEIKGLYYGRQAIMAILTQEDCVGMRVYFAQQTSSGTPTLVITGVKANGDDIHDGQLAEFGQPCPASCSVANPLNS